MPYQPKDGEGALFINDKKEADNPAHERYPDRKGHITAHRDIKKGEKLELAGWIKRPEGKNPLLSLKMSDPRGGQSQGQPYRRDTSSVGRDDDLLR